MTKEIKPKMHRRWWRGAAAISRTRIIIMHNGQKYRKIRIKMFDGDEKGICFACMSMSISIAAETRRASPRVCVCTISIFRFFWIRTKLFHRYSFPSIQWMERILTSLFNDARWQLPAAKISWPRSTTINAITAKKMISFNWICILLIHLMILWALGVRPLKL